MGKKQERRVNSKGKWKLLPGIFSLILLAVLVLAAAPSTPTTLSPANNSIFFNDTVRFSCSGSTDGDGDDIYYQFFMGQASYEYNKSAYESATNLPGYEFTQGTSYTNPNKLNSTRIGTGTGHFVWASDFVYLNNDNLTIQLYTSSEDAAYKIYIDGNQIWSNGSAGLTSQNLSFDVSAYTSGLRNLTFQLQDLNGGAGKGDIHWWGEFEPAFNYSQNSTSTTFDWDKSFLYNSDWRCKAVDENNDESAYTATRTISKGNFSRCLSGNIALNLTFEGENNTGTKINGSIPSLSLTFDTDDPGDYTFTYQNATEFNDYVFCMNPAGINIDTSGTVSYEASGWPQRTIALDRYLNGSSMYERTLYLLGTADGIYVTFQVVDVGNNVIEDVYVTASKVLDDTLTEVSSGYTDASGSVTFWLDPNTQHTFSASKDGVGSTTFSLAPTQSSYTITLGGANLVNQSSPYIGVNYLVTPSNIILDTNNTYNFTFDINSSYWNLTSFGFNLYNNSDLLTSESNNSLTGGYLLYEYNTTLNDTEITMDFWWLIDGNYTNITKSWDVRDTYTGAHSIKQFFDDFADYAAVGFNAGYDTFGGIIISLILLVLIVGGLSYSFGVYSPLGIMSLVFVTVAILEYVEILPPLIRKGLLSAILLVILVGYFAMEQSR